jgi:hypothetical protein
MKSRRPLLMLALIVLALAGTVITSAAPAHAAAPVPEPVRRVLILSMPAVSYRDLNFRELPNLHALLSQSALADLSVRGVHRRPSLDDGYVTIGAGTRSVGRAPEDGECLASTEPFEGGSAGQTMARRAGLAPDAISENAIVCLAQPAIITHNSTLLFEAKIGALAGALNRAGIQRAAIGNADEAVPVGEVGYERGVGLALADANGVVPGGAVGPELLTRDPAAPFGLRANPKTYLAAFERSWAGRSVVMVEASDLVRYDAYRTSVAKPARLALQRGLMRRWDAFVGQMLKHVDPARDAVMVVGTAHMGGTARLTMATLKAPGVEPGLLRSAYTRHSGVVSIVDVAPTVLHLMGIERPSKMEGRVFEVGGKGGSFENRMHLLVDVDEAARFRDRMIAPVTTSFVAASITLTVLAVLSFLRYRRALPVIEFAAIALLGYLPAVYLSRLFPFEDWAWQLYWLFLIGVALALALVTWFTTSRYGITTTIVILSIVVGVIAIDVATGAHLQFNSTFGYSPTVAGRYAGIGNVAYAQLSAGALLLAGLIATRVGGNRGTWIAIALMAAVFVIDGAPFFGADVGGVLSMVPAYAFTATLLLGWRVRWRSVVLYGAAAAVLVGLFAGYDASRPEDEQTHLGRLVHSTTDGGWSSFITVIQRKLDANLNVLFRTSWSVMFPIVLVGVLYLYFFPPANLRALVDRIPPLRAALCGLVVLAVLGFALNDSGIAIPGMMLGVVGPVLIVLAARGERVLSESAHDGAEHLRELVRT